MIGLHCKRFLWPGGGGGGGGAAELKVQCLFTPGLETMTACVGLSPIMNTRGWLIPHLIDKALPIVSACQSVLFTAVIVRPGDCCPGKTNSALN